jgi:uncharacterized protein YfdQ (DUF2303 family)
VTPDDTRQPLSAGTETRAAFEAGASHGPKEQIVDTEGGSATVLVATVPWGGEQVVFDPERYEATPRARRGPFTVYDVDSLVAYTKRHADPAATATWVDMTSNAIVSVLNDHGTTDEAGADPRWGDHQAVMPLKTTPEWDHWTKHDGDLVGQEAFAEHIEDGVREIVTPDAASMLEIAQTFHAHTDAQFRQATRLASGQVNLRYDEETTARAGTNGEMEVPSVFTLGISPFLGEQPYEVTARLRFRVSGGTLRIGYKLDRPEQILRDAMLAIAERLRGELDTPVFIGRPASPVERANHLT